MFDLLTFDLTQASLTGAHLRQLGSRCRSLEQASQLVAHFFYDQFGAAANGQSDIVLARCFKTHPLADLPDDLSTFARGLFPALSLDSHTRCLTLLGTFGDAPEWRSRFQSAAHQAIPLANESILQNAPMIARLTEGLGLDARDVVRPDSAALQEKDRRGFNVFYVEDARGCPNVPAQDFVTTFGVRSVIGFGFVLPPAQIFATLLFCRCLVPQARAAFFKTVALSLKVGLLPLVSKPVFENVTSPSLQPVWTQDTLSAQVSTLTELVSVHEEQVRSQLELIHAQQAKLEATASSLAEIHRILPGALFTLDSNGVVRSVNDAAMHLLGHTENDIVGRPVGHYLESGQDLIGELREAATRGHTLQRELVLVSSTGERIPMFVSGELRDTGDQASALAVCVAIDLRDRKRLEMELRQAQKLESLGRLAAGVAHEINTPVQYVANSVTFLRDAANDLLGIVGVLTSALQAVVAGEAPHGAAADALEAAEAADLPYLVEHIPLALDRCLDGLNRVATIVRSMKEFAHPDSTGVTTIDLNHAIESTLVIASNQYKHVADVQTNWGVLPPVNCYAGEFNQVVLNIIVNAAQAIDEVVKGTDRRGTISVRTEEDGQHVVIRISDTGGGVPESIRERIFDPFFTTKEVGVGTGQGLAIARSIIVDKHKGELTLESDVGSGSTFVVRLPIAQADR